MDAKEELAPVSLEFAGISTYVISVSELVWSVWLGITTSYSQELKKLGMKQFTLAQSYSIPYIFGGKNTILVSPSSTGKTLSYLLPLLSVVNSKCGGNKVNV